MTHKADQYIATLIEPVKFTWATLIEQSGTGKVMGFLNIFLRIMHEILQTDSE